MRVRSLPQARQSGSGERDSLFDQIVQLAGGNQLHFRGAVQVYKLDEQILNAVVRHSFFNIIFSRHR